MNENFKMVGRMKFVFLLLGVLFLNSNLSAQALSGTKTIGGSGDYASFTAAVDALKANGVSGPVTFNVLAGNYNEQISIPAITGTSAINTITFKGLGSTTKIYATPATDNRPVISLDSTSHIILDGLKIEVLGVYGWGVHFRTSDSISIQNCHIIAPTNADNRGVMASDAVSADLFTKVNIEYLSITNTVIDGGSYGIYAKAVNGPTANYGTDIVVSGCTIKGFGKSGMELSYNHNIDILGNEVSSTLAGTNAAIRIWDAGVNINITGNKLYLGGQSNVQHTRVIALAMNPNNGTAGEAAKPRIIANNFIHYDGLRTSDVYAIVSKNISYVKIYHNTIKMGSTTSSGNAILYQGITTREVEDFDVINNVFYTAAEGGMPFFINNAGVGKVMKNLTISHNNYYCSSTYSSDSRFYMKIQDYGSTMATTYFTFADYILSTLKYGVGAMNIDPEFVSDTDLHTFSAAMNNKGKAIAGITHDIDNEARDVVAPDMGADEYTPLTDDIAVVELVNPVKDTKVGVNDTIEVKVINLATNPHQKVPMFYSVNGSVAVVDTLESIGVNDTVSFKFSAPANFPRGGDYTIKVYSGLSNDQNRTNDTLVENLLLCGDFAGHYTINSDGSGDFMSIKQAVTSISTCGITDSVVFNIAPGVYEGQVRLGNIAGAGTNSITFRSSTGKSEDVILSFPTQSSSNSNYIVELRGLDYVILENLTFERKGADTYSTFIEIEGASNKIIRNCVFNGEELASIGHDSYNAMIYSNAVSTKNITIENNVFNNNGVGVYLGGISAAISEGCNILNNQFNNQYKYPVFIKYSKAPVVSGNQIYSRSASTSFQAIRIETCPGNLEVTANKIDATETRLNRGILILDCYATTANMGLVANNVIVGKTQVGTDAGIQLHKVNAQTICYNSINIIGVLGRSIGVSNACDTVVIKNNSFVNSGTGEAAFYNTADSTVSTGIEIDHNNYYVTGSLFVKWGANYVNDLAALKTASSKDQNSVSVNPLYMSKTDLRPLSVKFDGGATPLAAVTIDIDGNLRDATKPDIGAYEFTPKSDDLSIVEIFRSGESICGDAQDTIWAVVRNLGTNTQTSVGVKAEVTTVSGTTVLDQTIASIGFGVMDTIQLGLANTAVSGGSTSVKVYQTIADQDAANDTIEVSLGYNPMVDLGDDFKLCANNNILLDAGVNPACSFKWFDNSTSQTLFVDSNNFLAGSTTIVDVLVTSAEGCTAADTVDVTIVSVPAILPSVSLSGNAAICEGDSTMITLNLTGTAPWEIEVLDNQGYTSTETIPTSPFDVYVQPQGDAKFIITSVNDAVGCPAEGELDSVEITVNTIPTATTALTETEVCLGDSIELSIDLGGRGPWNIYVNDGATASVFTNVTTSTWTTWVDPTVTAIYSVDSITDNIGCVNTSDANTEVVVNALPEVELGNDTALYMVKSSAITLNAGSGFVDYLWNTGDDTEEVTIDPSVMTEGAHEYFVVVTDSNSCKGRDTIFIEIVDDLGFNQAIDNSALEVYPNPTTGVFALNLNNVVGDVNIQLLDAQGRIVYAESIQNTNNTFQKNMDINSLADGVYYLRLITEDGSYMRKIVKK